MKKYLLIPLFLIGCVPPGYVKDPKEAPATKADINQLRQDLFQVYQALEAKINPQPKPSPTPDSVKK